MYLNMVMRGFFAYEMCIRDSPSADKKIAVKKEGYADQGKTIVASYSV